jgi:hypothetical protein
MAKPSLPSRPEDTWNGGFVLDRARPVWSVSGAGGLVLGGGDVLYMMRPGARAWQSRPAEEQLGRVLVVAAEQRQPWRYAVSSERGITIYGLPKDQKLTLAAQTSAPEVTHLAWGNFEKQRVLYLRWEDGGVGRVRLDLGTIEDLDVAPMDALGADANGAVAMVSLRGGGEPHALFTRDGVHLEERPAVAIPEEVDEEALVHLAVADTAVAYAVEGWGAYLSRGVDDAFVAVPALAPGGPLAFQGSAAGAALLGAVWSKTTCAIHRVDAQGAVQRIAEISSEDGDAPRLTAVSWDVSRHVLWSASPVAGIMESEEPRGKSGKKRSLN